MAPSGSEVSSHDDMSQFVQTGFLVQLKWESLTSLKLPGSQEENAKLVRENKQWLSQPVCVQINKSIRL